MGPIIVDTSVWVDGLRGAQTKQVALITDYIKAYKQSKQLYITPTILQEVLQGVRDNSRYETIRVIIS